eukprot:6852561-Pyramimonas_sp.AAC.1
MTCSFVKPHKWSDRTQSCMTCSFVKPHKGSDRTQSCTRWGYPSLMRGLLPPTPLGTPPGGASRGARLVRSPGEAGQRQGNTNHQI